MLPEPLSVPTIGTPSAQLHKGLPPSGCIVIDPLNGLVAEVFMATDLDGAFPSTLIGIDSLLFLLHDAAMIAIPTMTTT